MTRCVERGGSYELAEFLFAAGGIFSAITDTADSVLLFEAETTASADIVSRAVAAGIERSAGEFTVSEVQTEPAVAVADSDAAVADSGIDAAFHSERGCADALPAYSDRYIREHGFAGQAWRGDETG